MTEPAKPASNLLWSSRFSSGPSDALAALSASVHYDWRLATYDIAGSRAHARALHRAGLLTDQELDGMLAGLDKLEQDVESGSFLPTVADEDCHTALERGLIERIGPELGGKLRAGRSRNDQIATLGRMFLREHARVIGGLLVDLQQALADQAESHLEVVMPGRTHLQHAQPVLLAHHLLAHVHALGRDADRLHDWDRRTDVSPYGSGALAGSTLGLDPSAVAAELGFSASSANSIDGTASRDYVAEFAFVAAMIGVHVSRIAEEIILWTTREFGFATLDDAYATGSSIMPQKKNPDVPELARGKTGRVNGHLIGLLTLMKGQPLAYNKDNQEDKEPLFDTVDTVADTLRIFAEMVAGITVKPQAMRDAALQGFSTATDLADYLVKRGLPFRDAHEAVALAVRVCADRGCDLADLTLEEMRKELPNVAHLIGEDVFSYLTLEGSVASRNHPGGTAPEQVLAAVKAARAALK